MTCKTNPSISLEVAQHQKSMNNTEANEIFQHFTLKAHVGSAGQELLWKMYDAERISDMKICTVFIFEKKIADKLHKPRRRDVICAVLRRDVKILESIKHPRVLQVIHPVEESNEMLCFATEHVICSLSNVLGDVVRCPHPLSDEVTNFDLSDLIRIHGIFQLTDVLRYLHTSVRAIHGNICPSSILITKKGHWKLGSMAFLQQIPQPANTNSPNQNNEHMNAKIDFGPSPWNKKLPKMARPVIEFMAPECCYALNNSSESSSILQTISSNNIQTAEFGMRPGPWSDMYSLALVICRLYKHRAARNSLHSMKANTSQSANGLSDNNQNYSSSQYSKSVFSNSVDSISMNDVNRIQNLITSNEYPDLFRESFEYIPLFYIEPLEKMLCRTLKRRPSSQMFSLLKIFNESQILCYDGLLSFDLKGIEERNKNLSLFKTMFEEYPKEFLMTKLFDLLLEAFEIVEALFDSNPMKEPQFSVDNPNETDSRKTLSPLILGRNLTSCLASIVNISNVSEYFRYLQDKALAPFRISQKIQMQSFLLNHVEQFSKHASYEEVKNDILPVSLKCLESNSSEGQIASLDAMKHLLTYYEKSFFKETLWPKCRQGIIRGVEKPRLQRSASNCLCEIISLLEDRILIDQVIPFLLDISTEFLTLTSTINIDSQDKNMRAYSSGNSLNLLANFGKSVSDNSHTIHIICKVWLRIIEVKSESLDAKLIANEIFPSLLPHVTSSYLKHIEFRTLVQVLYGLLETLENNTFNSGSDDSSENIQYQIYPAINKKINTSQSYSQDRFPSSSSTRQINEINGSQAIPFVHVMDETKRNSEVKDSFSPMIHPNLLKQTSANMNRRSTASVICPLPIQDDSVLNNHHRDEKRNFFDQISRGNDMNYKDGVFGLKIPSISIIRRYSGETQLSPSNSNMRRSSVSIATLLKSSPFGSPRGSLNSTTLQHRDLLTARVCEGPFVSAPSSRSSSRRPSNFQSSIKTQDSSKIPLLSPNSDRKNSHRSSFGNIGDTVLSLINQNKSTC